MACVGRSVTRVDAIPKVTGQIKYVDDIFVPNMLHAKVFRSTVANGWVKSIDISRAKALAGVEAVFTYEDVPDIPFATAGHPYHPDPAHQDVAGRLLLNRKVRLYGDDVAVVVAESEFIAGQAVKLITAEYESVPPILNCPAALAAGAPEIHAGTGNLLKKSSYKLGDMDEAWKKSDRIFTGNYSTSMVQHCAMENHAAYAYIDDNGKVTVVSATQIPHITRRIVAQALGLSWGKVRVIKPYVGGGFGSKQDLVVEALTALLTVKLAGRPVKLQYTREETFFASRIRHAIDFSLKTGFTDDGKFIARWMEAFSDNGGYTSHGHSVVSKSSTMFRTIYDQQAIECDVSTVYTNKPSAGAMRGYGVPQITFALEAHVDDIAKQLGMDPVEIRLKNLLKDGYADQRWGFKTHTNSLPECIDKGRELIGWDAKRAAYGNQTGLIRRGVGMACFSYTCNVYPFSMEVAGARIVVNEDGSMQLMVGATEIGQGSDTAFLQMVAETVGVPVENLYIVSNQDTEISPYDTGSYASRQTYVTGMAVAKAAREVKFKLIEQAGKMGGFPSSNLDIKDGWIINESGAKLLTVSEVALDACADINRCAPITADVVNNAGVNALCYGCTFVDVEVDMALGKVYIKELYNIHDSGRIINPQLAAGQVHGGVSMALGYALYEQMLFDEKSGKMLNPNLLDYKLMTAIDTPEIEAHFIEPYEPTGPYGNKSLGEPPACSPAPAIRNAILNATDVAIDRLPMNPHHLVKIFKEQGKI